MEVGDAEDFSPEFVIEHVKKLVNASAEEKEAMTLQSFTAALEEEVALLKPDTAVAEAPVDAGPTEEFDLAETVAGSGATVQLSRTGCDRRGWAQVGVRL